MSDKASHAGWWSVISDRVRERDIRRQIRYNNARKAGPDYNYLVSFVADHVSSILLEFLKMMLGSLLAFWIIGKLLEFTLSASPLYTFAVFGLFYSAQATYYKYRLSVDPSYEIPTCRCAGRRNDKMAMVLQSRESAILGVPSSVLGAVFYSSLLVLAYLKQTDTVLLVAIVAGCMSAYLSYVMVVKVGSLCLNCTNVSALNMLILFQVLMKL